MSDRMMDAIVTKKPVVRGVIFDCDGVLVDTENLANRVLTDLLCEYGCDMTPAQSHQFFIGGTLAAVAPKMAESFGVTLPDDWIKECYARTFKSFEKDLKPYPDLDPVLDLLDAKGIPMAIGSNGPHDKWMYRLARSGCWIVFVVGYAPPMMCNMQNRPPMFICWLLKKSVSTSPNAWLLTTALAACAPVLHRGPRQSVWSI